MGLAPHIGGDGRGFVDGMDLLMWILAAARNALKRKKQHEHSLEQTNGQINMLEQQIYSIESANINQETLVAMKNAGAAMKQIHGKMTMEDVDVTMYVALFLFFDPHIVIIIIIVTILSSPLHPTSNPSFPNPQPNISRKTPNSKTHD